MSKKNNSITLNKDNSNKELIANAIIIQIALFIILYLFTIAYRILIKTIKYLINKLLTL